MPHFALLECSFNCEPVFASLLLDLCLTVAALFFCGDFFCGFRHKANLAFLA